MRCSHCGTDNLQGSKFCDQCGKPLRETPTPAKEQRRRRKARGSDVARAYFSNGKAFYRAGEYTQAIAAYQQAIELDPTHASYFCELARTYLLVGQHRDALQAVRRAIELKPKYAYAYYLLGYIYYEQGRFEDAVQEYQKAMMLGENSAAIYFHLGKAYEKMGRLDEAIAAYQKALVVEPGYRYAEERLQALR